MIPSSIGPKECSSFRAPKAIDSPLSMEWMVDMIVDMIV